MVADWETFITIFYSLPIIVSQFVVCILLWRQTKDARTWGLFVTGSLTSVVARFVIYFPAGIPIWIDDVLRAFSMTINTLGFFSLYLLLNRLIKAQKHA